MSIFKSGQHVSGESFIGRKNLVREWKERGYSKNGLSAYSLVGYKGAGKSSLIKKAFNKDEAAEQGMLFINPVFDSAAGFISYFKTCCKAILTGIGKYFQDKYKDFEFIEEKLKEIDNSEAGYESIKELCEEVFLKLAEKDIYLLLIIDDFDIAARVFENKPEYFSCIRDFLTQKSEYKINSIIISRRTVKHIEMVGCNESSLAGALTKKYIKGFDADDMQAYYNLLKDKYGLDFDGEAKSRVEYFCGCSPYLLSVFGAYFAENDETDADIAYEAELIDIHENFERITNTMQAEDLLEKVLSVTRGPQIAVEPKHFNFLKRTGLIHENKDGGYTCVSEAFTEYLDAYSLNIDTWHLLLTLEKAVRLMIGAEMPGILGCKKEEWQECFKLRMLDENDDLRKSFGVDHNRISDRLERIEEYLNKSVPAVEVLSMAILFKILEVKWNIFAAYFVPSEFEKWNEKFKKCAEARNPLAHGSELRKDDKRLADTYIDEILSLEKIKKLVAFEINKIKERNNGQQT